MKNIIILLLFLPTLLFSQGIPKKLKILNVSYDKPKGTKIEKEKKEKKKKWKPRRRRNIRYQSLGLGLGTSTFLNQKNKVNWYPSSTSIFWHKKWRPRLHSLLSINYTHISIPQIQEQVAENYSLWSLELIGNYYLRPSNRIYYRRKHSPYLLGGLNFTYHTQQANIGYNFGLGYRIRMNDRWDLYLEQKVNYFRQNQQEFWVGNSQIMVSYIFHTVRLRNPAFHRYRK